MIEVRTGFPRLMTLAGDANAVRRSRTLDPRRPRRGMLLIVVLLIIVMLGLLGGSFAFRMNAELAGVKAATDLQQARLAARSGIDRMVYLLRDKRTDIDFWYDNAEDFRRVLVWAPGLETGSTNLWDKDPVPNRPAWRFSIVSYRELLEHTGDDTKMRYGLTDEAGKINLNEAPRGQLLALFRQIKRENVVPEMLADSLVDWRDEDDVPTSQVGAESSFYMKRNPPYRAKNRPLQSVEELLMIRGFDGQILWGEDANRNGYLDQNEDDGEEGVFPPDNGDGILDRGIYPFLTVFSWDWNASNDNKRRIPISMVKTAELLEDTRFEYLSQEIRLEVIDFIVAANQRGYKFRSIGELCGIEIYENKKSNYTAAWKAQDQLVADLNQDGLDTGEEGEGTGEGNQDQGGGSGDSNLPNSGDQGNAGGDPNQPDNDGNEDAGTDSGENKNRRRQQSVRDGDADSADKETSPGGPTSDSDARRSRGQDRPSRSGDNRSGNDAREGRRTGPGVDFSDRRRDRGPQSQPGESDEITDQMRATALPNPITPQDMVAICDRFTVSTEPVIAGRINVNTASPVALRTVPGLTEEQVTAIVSQREQLSGEEKASIGWLVSSGVLDPQTFAMVSDMLTTRSIQFSADVIGFADHAGAYKRYQVVIEMRGQMSQTVYFRDISSLGAGYPVRDDERSEGLAYIAQ